MNTVSLGVVATFQAGYGFPKKYQGLEAGDYPFAKVGDISIVARRGEQVIDSARNYINEDTLPLIKAKVLPAGSIVFAKIGEAIRQNFRAITACPMLIDNNTMGMIPNPALVDTKYLFYFMRQLDLYQFTSATSVPALRKSRLESLKIPLPPLAEQQRIAAILDQADMLRAKRRAALAKLDTLLQATFIDMFGDPVTNPMRWELVRLSDIINDLRYGTGSPPGYTDTGIPFIRATNIKNGTVVEKDLRFIPQNEANKISKCKLKTGDLIVVRSGVNSGDCAIIPEQYNNAYAGYDIIVELPFNWAVFTNHFINSPQGQHIIKPMTRRAGQPHLNADQIKSISLLKPSLEKLEQFKNFWARIGKMKQTHLIALDELDNLFHALQQRAFKGQL